MSIEDPQSKSKLRTERAQGVTFIELFFDLVFVFAVTQLSGVLVDDLTPRGVVRTLIVFWLVWWAWTQWTWSLNAADTEYGRVRFLTLVATGAAFVMALTVPTLSGEDAATAFALAYLTVRILGIALQWHLARDDLRERAAVRSWTIMSSLGLVTVAALPVVPPRARLATLGLAALFDVVAAIRAGSGDWRLIPAHFVERHGLFVIIALGESLFATGLAAIDEALTGTLLIGVLLALTATGGLWWLYFGWPQPALEEAMEDRDQATMGRFARNVYSFGHFPIIAGIIGFAAGAEQVIAHPGDPMGWPVAVAVALGATLFVAGTGVALRLAGVGVGPLRWVAPVVLLASIPWLSGLQGLLGLTIVTVLVIAFGVVGDRSRPVSGVFLNPGGELPAESGQVVETGGEELNDSEVVDLGILVHQQIAESSGPLHARRLAWRQNARLSEDREHFGEAIGHGETFGSDYMPTCVNRRLDRDYESVLDGMEAIVVSQEHFALQGRKASEMLLLGGDPVEKLTDPTGVDH